MAKSFIGLAEDHKVIGIYSHWEPYDKNTAQILLEHYQSFEKLRELIVLGDILFLDRDIARIEKPVGNISEETTFPSISSAIKNSWIQHHAEYCYIYHNGMWLGFSSKPETHPEPIRRDAENPEPLDYSQIDYSNLYDPDL